MQWIVLMARPNAYLPRTPGEKVNLNIMAVNVEANSSIEAHLKALEITEKENDRKWITLEVVRYHPVLHDNIAGYVADHLGDDNE